MADITAAMVKALREETGGGMMECKKALIEAGGNAEDARDALRAKGLAMAEKKAGRDTSEGLVAIASGEGQAAMVEVRCETDFCARKDEFRTMVA
ncbi:MAG: elongation factor Ts, partial [Phycisphaerae bacterium]|nr:elongation factor Ts [Phycisphaerae bacterium]